MQKSIYFRKKFTPISLKFRATVVAIVLCRFHPDARRYRTYLSWHSCKLYSQRGAGRKSQRPFVTSPSNINLSATSSMLIPHSNSRSSCGAQARISPRRENWCAKRNGPQYRAYPRNCRVTVARLLENVRDYVLYAERKIWYLTGPSDTLTGPQTIDSPLLHHLSQLSPLCNESIDRDFLSGPKMKGALRKALRLIGEPWVTLRKWKDLSKLYKYDNNKFQNAIYFGNFYMRHETSIINDNKNNVTR